MIIQIWKWQIKYLKILNFLNLNLLIIWINQKKIYETIKFKNQDFIKYIFFITDISYLLR